MLKKVYDLKTPFVAGAVGLGQGPASTRPATALPNLCHSMDSFWKNLPQDVRMKLRYHKGMSFLQGWIKGKMTI